MARRKPISTLRGRRSFSRRAGQKAPRSVTLIVCEGETEQEYFEAVRIHYGLSTAEVVVAENTVGSAPKSVVQCAERKCAERGGYDKVFCIMDRDGHESFDQARATIKTLAGRKRKPLPIEEAVSIPCFEVWVLLHFERADPPFTRCTDVIQRIRDNHMPGYEKADRVVIQQLMQKINEAVSNAQWLEARAADNNHNPFTSIHKVVRHFIDVAGKDS
ncbi:MAG: RloB domain-containing protein [Burkholderiales bacterium]|nr:RloB domain-containing protein [Burkholderiales bacterium]